MAAAPALRRGVRRAKATLEMDLVGRAPEGPLTSADGLRVGFSGWAELASAIEEWRIRARDQVDGSHRKGGQEKDREK